MRRACYSSFTNVNEGRGFKNVNFAQNQYQTVKLHSQEHR